MKQITLAKLACLSMVGVFALAQMAQAQPGRGGFGGGGFMGGFMNPSGLGLMGDEKVQKELELDENQIERMQELQREMGTEMREAFSDMQGMFQGGGGNREEVMREIRERAAEITKDFDELAEKELLTHQKSRLKQLVLHAQVRRTGGATAGTLPDEVTKQLDITDDQKAKMEEKAKSVREDLEKKVANLRKQAEEEILSVLTKEQQEKYKELMGDSFEFSQPNIGRVGGQGRGEGGQGRGEGGRGEGGRGRGGRGGDRDF